MSKKKHEPVKAPKGTTKGRFSGKYGTPNLEKKLEGLSEAIECVQVAAKKLDQSNLTREAIVILIQHAAGAGKLTKAQINLVLDTLLELGETYLKKTPLCGRTIPPGEWVTCEECLEDGCDDCMFDPDSGMDLCPDCRDKEDERRES